MSYQKYLQNALIGGLLLGNMSAFSQISGCALPDIFAPAVVSCENVVVYNAPDPNAEKLTTLHFAVNSVTIQRDSMTVNGRKYMNVITDEGVNGWIDKGCLLVRGEGAAMKCAIMPTRMNFDKDAAVTNTAFDAGELVLRVERSSDNIYVRNLSGTKRGWVNESCLMTDAENLALAWRLHSALASTSVCDRSDKIKAIKTSYPGLEYTQMGEFVNDAYETATAKCFTQKTEPAAVATTTAMTRGLKPATITKTEVKPSKEVAKPSTKPETTSKTTQSRGGVAATSKTVKKIEPAKPQPEKTTKPATVVAVKPIAKTEKTVAAKPKMESREMPKTQPKTEVVAATTPKPVAKPVVEKKANPAPKTVVASREIAQRVFDTDEEKKVATKAKPIETALKSETRGMASTPAAPIKGDVPCKVTNVTMITQTASPVIANEEIISKNAQKEVQKVYQVRNKYTETLKLIQIVELNNAKSVAYTCYHPTLPIGTHLNVKLPKNEGFVEFVVVAKLNKQEGLGLSQSSIERLFGKKPPTTVEIEYFTVNVD